MHWSPPMISLNLGAFTMNSRNTERRSVCRNDDIIQHIECWLLSIVLGKRTYGEITSEVYWFITEIIMRVVIRHQETVNKSTLPVLWRNRLGQVEWRSPWRANKRINKRNRLGNYSWVRRQWSVMLFTPRKLLHLFCKAKTRKWVNLLMTLGFLMEKEYLFQWSHVIINPHRLYWKVHKSLIQSA